jgi:DNA-binding YbaB/EbfC family protein
MGSMMGKMQKMQEDMDKAREELETQTVEISVGGGAVTVVMNGHQRLQSLKIKGEMIDTTDPEWISDFEAMVGSAVNQAIEASQTLAAERMEGVYGGLGNIPGLSGLLGG